MNIKAKVLVIAIILLASVVLSGCVDNSAENERENTSSISGSSSSSSSDETNFEKANGSEQTNTAVTGVSKLVVGTTMIPGDINLGDTYFDYFTDLVARPSMVTINEKGDILPYLADSWENVNGTLWTFHLNKNAVWEDGTPVTSKDVKFMMGYRVAKLPTFSASFSYVDSVETPDDHTLVVKLKEPFKSFLYDIETSVIPMHVFQGIDEPLKYTDKRATLSGGPYTFVSYDKQAGVLTYKVNEKYWGKKPNVDVIEIKTYKTKDVMMLALQNGEIDLPYIYGDNIDSYYLANIQNNKNLKVDIYSPPAVTKVIWFNNNRTLYDNADLRGAFSYAVDYEEINRLINGGLGEVADVGFIPVSAPNHIETRKMVFDKNKSIVTLEELGYKDRDSDGFRETPDGKKFRPQLLLGPEDTSSDNYRIGQLLKKYFNNVGVDIQFGYLDNPTLWDRVETKEDFDLWLGGAGTWMLIDYAGYWTGAFDARSWGWAAVTDPEYTAMVDKLIRTNDPTETANIIADMQRYYAKNLPALPLYTSKKIQPYSNKYEGWKYHYIWGIFNLETMYNIHKTK